MENYDSKDIYFPRHVYIENMIHHAHCANHILKHQTGRVLVIGPGDHTVVDCLRRRGLQIDTLDIDPLMKPTHIADIRDLSGIREKYQLICANEVLEHSKIEGLPNILDQVSGLLESGGLFYISVPHSVIRIFPKKGFIVDGGGRINTYLPLHYYHDVLTPIRKIARLIKGNKEKIKYIEDYAPDRFDVHHWDSGYRPTTTKFVRKIFSGKFDIIEDRIIRYPQPYAADTWNVVMRKKS